MADGRVKVYEDGKRGGVPVWAWLLPLLLILGLLAWYLLHRRSSDAAATAAVPAAVQGTDNHAVAMPSLGSVHFATNEATLLPDGQATLAQAATYMKQNPGAHLRVEGYTDATGSAAHNETLSERRSDTVVKYLEGQGIVQSRLTGEGFGQENPVDTNATPTGKADNRRVQLFQQ